MQWFFGTGGYGKYDKGTYYIYNESLKIKIFILYLANSKFIDHK